MSFISAWVMSILGVVILGTVIDLLLSKSRLKNFIRSVFATVSILIIITPLPSLIQNGFSINWEDIKGEVILDEGFLDYTQKLKIKALESSVTAAFADEGISGLKIDITATVENNEINVKRVTVDLKNSVINENLANINKYEFIKEKVKKYIGKTEVEIIING